MIKNSEETTWFGSEVLTDHDEGQGLRDYLRGRKVGILAHSASLDRRLRPVWERVAALGKIKITALFGPQHGFAGEKQDNMIESGDAYNPELDAPVFSLYGETRRLKPEWLDYFDVLLIDLQDVGVRVYTFLTTLAYILEDLANRDDKEVWILDRPNPVGRAVEGLRLRRGHESFVGAAEIPMQHGLTMGEFASWYIGTGRLNTRLKVVPMIGWKPENPWPMDHPWLQPSPNMPGLYTARSYPGTVLLEATTLSEGRGTTRPLSLFGHPEVNWEDVHGWIEAYAPGAFDGVGLRRAVFEPTFHKHSGKRCGGYELIAEDPLYDPRRFKPYRLITWVLMAIRRQHPDLPLWISPPYEYEYRRMPIDVISGSDRLRRWVDGDGSAVDSLEAFISADEESWREEIRGWLLYGGREKGQSPDSHD